MIPSPFDKQVAFLPSDRIEVYEHCRSLYNLTQQDNGNERSFSEFIRRTAFALLGGNRHVDNVLERAANEKRAPRILLFRYDAVGDYIVTSPFVRYMQEAVPNVEIDVVASSRNAGMIKHDPFISEVAAIHPGHSPHPSWAAVRKHSARRPPDIVAALVFTKMTKAAILASFAGSQAARVTIEHSRRKETYGKVFDLQISHQVAKEHYMETMTKVGPAICGASAKEPEPYIVIESSSLSNTVQRLKHIDCGYSLPATRGIVPEKGHALHNPGLAGRPYVVINVSAYSPNRQWNAHIACCVANEIARQRPEIVCFVTGGPDASELVSVAANATNHPRVHQWKGTLAEFSALIAGASLVVTPDTAAVHMASACKVPVVALYAEIIKVAEWFPYNTKYRALLSPNPNTINDITVDFVSNHALELV